MLLHWRRIALQNVDNKVIAYIIKKILVDYISPRLRNTPIRFPMSPYGGIQVRTLLLSCFDDVSGNESAMILESLMMTSPKLHPTTIPKEAEGEIDHKIISHIIM